MSIQSYDEARRVFETTRRRKLANNTWLLKNEQLGYYAIRLHDTEVVQYYPDKTVLNSGGWRTVMRKERLNCFSPFGIWQDKGVWYVQKDPGDYENYVAFADGMYYRQKTKKWYNTGKA